MFLFQHHFCDTGQKSEELRGLEANGLEIGVARE